MRWSMMLPTEKTSIKGEEKLKLKNIYSFFTRRNNTNYSSMSYFIMVILCVHGLFILKCEAAVLQPRNPVRDIQDKLSVVDKIRSETNEHEPPVTSSDLPKQIPAPPRPHFASTPHYEQQLARFVWVTPQYNTPSYPIVNQVR